MLHETEPVAHEFCFISALSCPVPVAAEIESPSTAIDVGVPVLAGVGPGAARRAAAVCPVAIGALAASAPVAPASPAASSAAASTTAPARVLLIPRIRLDPRSTARP